jgi:hypothetical protein
MPDTRIIHCYPERSPVCNPKPQATLESRTARTGAVSGCRRSGSGRAKSGAANRWAITADVRA